MPREASLDSIDAQIAALTAKRSNVVVKVRMKSLKRFDAIANLSKLETKVPDAEQTLCFKNPSGSLSTKILNSYTRSLVLAAELEYTLKGTAIAEYLRDRRAALTSDALAMADDLVEDGNHDDDEINTMISKFVGDHIAEMRRDAAEMFPGLEQFENALKDAEAFRDSWDAAKADGRIGVETWVAENPEFVMDAFGDCFPEATAYHVNPANDVSSYRLSHTYESV